MVIYTYIQKTTAKSYSELVTVRPTTVLMHTTGLGKYLFEALAL